MSKFVFCKSQSCRGRKSRIGIEGKPLPKDGSPRLYICLTCNEERQYDLWDLRDDEGHFTLGLPETHVKCALMLALTPR
jgi:hypothetical protein